MTDAKQTYGYEKNGRRFTITGDTRCAPKGSLGKYGIGLNFDWDTKTWWTGKEDIAKKAVDFLREQSASKEKTLSACATYTKLPDGSWGVRVPSAIAAVSGEEVTVHKSNGETKLETLGASVASEEGHALFAVVRKQRSGGRRYSRGRRDSAYCYYPCPVGGFKCCPENGPCHDCQ